VQAAAAAEAVRAGKVAMRHQTWGADVDDATPPMFLGANPAANMNRDGEVSDLFDRGNTSFDPEVRKASYAKAFALIQERAYALPLFSLPIYYVAAKDLVFTSYPDEIIRFWEMSWK
jgi:peptide/nickel transport system substrate-binding protein